MRMQRIFKDFQNVAAITAICLTALLRPDTAAADLSSTLRFDIAAQQLPDALLQYSAQSGVQISGLGELMEGKASSAVVGTFEARGALQRLLAGTGLEFDVIDGNTVAIRRDKSASAVSSSSDRSDLPERIGASTANDALLLTQNAQSEQDAQSNAENEDPTTRSASTAEAEDPSLQEIVVTAQRRQERLQDVPISISVLSGADLDQSPVVGTTDALKLVPGVVTTVANQSGGSQVAVRGVAALSPILAGSSPIAYYLDSMPFGLVKAAIAPDTNAYDMERVEVLRGPQGTLYGASALNGVVRILTKDADLSRFEVKTRGSVASTKDGDESYRGDFAINVPLVPGKLAARGVVGYQDLSGWIERPNKENFNDAELLSARLKVNAQPTDALSFGLSAWVSRSDYGGPSASDDSGIRNVVLDEPISIDYHLLGLTIGYEFPRFSVTGTSSFIDYANAGLKRSAFSASMLFTGFDSEVFSHEIVLNSTSDGAWRWSAGALYRDGEDRLFQTFPTFPAPIDFSDSSRSIAVFGELTRAFFDGRFELTGGLRYFEDDVTQKENVRHTGIATEPLFGSNSTFDQISPRAVLAWHPNDDWTTYASYSEGFRSGFDQTANIKRIASEFPPLDADTLTNYEIGAKGSLWGGVVGFDTAVYYIDWQDVQQSLSVLFGGTTLPVLVNSGSASGLGLEIALSARPIDGLRLGVNFGWNDLTVDEDVLSAGIVLFRAGERINLSPEYTLGASVDSVFAIGASGYEGQFSLSGSYHSSQTYNNVIGGAQRTYVGDPIVTSRAGLALRSPRNWTATLFVENLTDESDASTRILAGGGGLPGNPDEAARLRPRTVGLQLDYSFK